MCWLLLNENIFFIDSILFYQFVKEKIKDICARVPYSFTENTFKGMFTLFEQFFVWFLSLSSFVYVQMKMRLECLQGALLYVLYSTLWWRRSNNKAYEKHLEAQEQKITWSHSLISLSGSTTDCILFIIFFKFINAFVCLI